MTELDYKKEFTETVKLCADLIQQCHAFATALERMSEFAKAPDGTAKRAYFEKCQRYARDVLLSWRGTEALDK